ncbi:MAG: hypothetical protein ACRDOK_30925 [Streptosporangiaceae bacterium]
MPGRIAVLIDFENVHRVGHKMFAAGRETFQCVPDPVKLADVIASRRSRDSAATSILVFRGRPNANYEPEFASDHDKQVSHDAPG